MESGIIFRISRLFPTQGFDRLSTSCDMPHASALTGFQVVLASVNSAFVSTIYLV